MARKVLFGDCTAVLDEFDYPIDRTAAADDLSEVTALLTDGEVNLGGVISEMASATFDPTGNREAELHNVLPREAVGEPYQSEGEE